MFFTRVPGVEHTLSFSHQHARRWMCFLQGFFHGCEGTRGTPTFYGPLRAWVNARILRADCERKKGIILRLVESVTGWLHSQPDANSCWERPLLQALPATA